MTEHIRNGAAATEDIERETMRKVIWRILPFLIVSYLVSIIDRGNIGMASLQMNEDLGLSKAAFGFASSLYFVAYFLFEVPSNLAMQKVGARLWIPRIMISWGWCPCVWHWYKTRRRFISCVFCWVLLRRASSPASYSF